MENKASQVALKWKRDAGGVINVSGEIKEIQSFIYIRVIRENISERISLTIDSLKFKSRIRVTKSLCVIYAIILILQMLQSLIMRNSPLRELGAIGINK